MSNTQSPWAIKKLLVNRKKDNKLKKRLESEANILKKLNHPNIIGFRAYIKTPDGRNCLAMEECTTCLGDMIEERFEKVNLAFPSKQILKVVADISSALDYLHNTALLLHCDMKSYNILVNGDFKICKLCDFGVCLPLDKNGCLDVEKVGEDVEYDGTYSWCPNEVFENPPIITVKADIYSFGLVIWEMLALSIPNYDEEEIKENFNLSDDSFSKNVVKRPPLPPQEFEEDYNPVLEIYYCCTHQDYTKRPTARDLNFAVQDVMREI